MAHQTSFRSSSREGSPDTILERYHHPPGELSVSGMANTRVGIGEQTKGATI